MVTSINNGQKKKVQKDKQRSTKHTHKTKGHLSLIRRENCVFDHVFPTISTGVNLINDTNVHLVDAY
jgi:hypothetical protein